MSEQQLPMMRRDSEWTLAEYTQAAIALRDGALSGAALIGKVTNAEENAKAVEAQKEIARVLSIAEKARTAVKEPALNFGRVVDQAAKMFVVDLLDEKTRLGMLAGGFQSLEMARVRAEQQKANEALSRLEKERAAEAAQVKTHEELDAVNARHDEAVRLAQAIAPVIAPVRAKGQSVRTEWQITVTDIWLLARAHPGLVTITPKLQDIRAMLDAGVKVAGITAEKAVASGVRAGRAMAAIEV